MDMLPEDSPEDAIATPLPRSANSSHPILVVDDDDDVRQLTLDVLTDSGYDVEGVKDGAAGWKALQTNNFDLVITDNKMPKMSGLEMIAKLRSARMSILVIMATGSLPMHEFASKPWLYPDATLQRPFSNQALLASVKKVIRRNDSYDNHMKMLLPPYL
jgi:DNA-binding response OmpR family regulator